MSEKILTLIEKANPSSVVIEVGGITTDLEHIYIPGALRNLAVKTGILPEIVLLSYLEHSEVSREGMSAGAKIKTQLVRQGIRDTIATYAGLPLKAVLVRRRRVPDDITTEACLEEMNQIAYETQIKPERVKFVENVADVIALKELIQSTGFFNAKEQPLWISACLLGVPCRFDGASKPADLAMNVLLKDKTLMIACPELLAGLPTPRGPFEIVNGDGEGVLNGTAQVIDSQGNDVSELFIQGAIRALKIAKSAGSRLAIVRSKSPSCSSDRLEDSQENQFDGVGVTVALFRRWGIKAVSPQEYFESLVK